MNDITIKLKAASDRLEGAKAEVQELSNIIAVSVFTQTPAFYTDCTRPLGTHLDRDTSSGG